MSLDPIFHAAEPDVPAAAARALSRTLMAAVLGDATGTEMTTLTVPRRAEPLAPARLARTAPGGTAGRRRARELYERCLRVYRDHLQDTDGLDDDVAAAAAHFVAANFQALHGSVASSTTRLALERQLAGLIRRGSLWNQASASERQAFFESMALLAVLIGESARQALRQGPAARDHLRQAARGYLRQLLGLEPDALLLGPDGLTLRDED